MKKKKKLLIIIGIVLIILGVILIPRMSTKEKSPHEGLNQSEKYVYKTIKTRDFDAKVVLSFPVYESMTEDILSDYYKTYSLGNKTIIATEIQEDSIKQIEGQDEKMKSYSFISNYTVDKLSIKNDYISSSDIEAKIVKYDKTDTEKPTSVCSLSVLVKISNSDYIHVTYSITDDEITEEEALDLVDNFRITDGAEYKAGTVDINELVIELEKTTLSHFKYNAKIALDPNQYEEIEDVNNSKEHTRVKNIVTNEEIEVYLFYRAGMTGTKLIDSLEIDLKNNSKFESISKFKETKRFANKIYEASTSDNIINVWMLDGEVCMVVIYPNGYEYIEDFDSTTFEIEK